MSLPQSLFTGSSFSGIFTHSFHRYCVPQYTKYGNAEMSRRWFLPYKVSRQTGDSGMCKVTKAQFHMCSNVVKYTVLWKNQLDFKLLGCHTLLWYLWYDKDFLINSYTLLATIFMQHSEWALQNLWTSVPLHPHCGATSGLGGVGPLYSSIMEPNWVKQISWWVPIAQVQGNQYIVTSPTRTGWSGPLNIQPGTLIC